MADNIGSRNRPAPHDKGEMIDPKKGPWKCPRCEESRDNLRELTQHLLEAHRMQDNKPEAE